MHEVCALDGHEVDVLVHLAHARGGEAWHCALAALCFLTGAFEGGRLRGREETSPSRSQKKLPTRPKQFAPPT